MMDHSSSRIVQPLDGTLVVVMVSNNVPLLGTGFPQHSGIGHLRDPDPSSAGTAGDAAR